jgi:hypothetical protein
VASSAPPNGSCRQLASAEGSWVLTELPNQLSQPEVAPSDNRRLKVAVSLSFRRKFVFFCVCVRPIDLRNG